jgi:hypothetical protein
MYTLVLRKNKMGPTRKIHQSRICKSPHHHHCSTYSSIIIAIAVTGSTIIAVSRLQHSPIIPLYICSHIPPSTITVYHPETVDVALTLSHQRSLFYSSLDSMLAKKGKM